MNWMKATGGAILILFLAAAVFGPPLAQFEPFAIDGERFLSPSATHWLGTNSLGQDIFSGIAHGARTTLFIGLAVALLSTALSGLLGLIAGYSNRLDPLLNALANMLLVLPSLLLILIVASFTGGGTWQLILTLGLLTWPGYMRLIRASVLSLKEREFVKAAKLFRGGTFYILRRHLLPFLRPLLKTKFILSFRYAVVMEASLSFLGIGDPNVPSWGKMLQQAFNQNETWMSDAWQWTILPPVLAIMLVTLGFALMGEKNTIGVMESRRIRDKETMAGLTTMPDELRQAGVGISANRLSVTYGERTIVHSVTFTIPAGSVTALIGESGSGKTTLARALYGLMPKELVIGNAYIAGKHIYGGDPGDSLKRWKDAAFIFQDPRSSFNPLLTIGKQFCEAIPDSTTIREKWQRAARALQEVQLDKRLLHSYPHELSGGMLSRALIALALLNNPAVLIADEPTSALDPIVKREVLELLATKVREQQMTLLLITHDLRAALYVADRIMTIQDGRLIDHAEKQEWKRSTQAKYVNQTMAFK